MKRAYPLLLGFFLFSCSSQESIRTDSAVETNNTLPPVVQSQPNAAPATSSDQVRNEQSYSLSVNGSASTDTTLSIKKTQQPAEPDSLENQQLYISQKLEEARQHYLAALAAQEAGDSTHCAGEFEEAIKALNELSYLPDIESNKDFTDLSQNVIEDYEKYITNIDNLGPDASVFALREKLSQIIEKVDISKVVVPKEEITGTTIALPFNEHVERNIAFFMGERGRAYFEKWLHLSGKYFPMMKRIFREEGIPEELVYLSMIESGLRPDARSWVKAVGLWQFMKGTGQLYGLRGNWWYDERRDFEKSTRAAARHLKDLYAEFGDWYVVLAAYNSGAGKIYRAIRRSGSTDYWAMRKYLPRQTRNYVPEFIAVVRMAMVPGRYGFHGISPADSLAFDLVRIDDCVDLRVLAKCAETDVETLRELNPELLQWCTPPGVTGYRLRIPQSKSEAFATNYTQVPEEQKRDWTVHTVRRGETLAAIAKHYGLTVDLLRDVNNVKTMKKLSVGSQLAIPIPREIMATRAKVPFSYDQQVKGLDFNQLKAYVARMDISRSARSVSKHIKSSTGKERLVYRVKRGDTIGHIAEWYGVRASDIRNWNDLAYGSSLQVNREVIVWVDPRRAAALERINEMSFAEKQSLRKEQLVQASLLGAAASSAKSRKGNDWIQYKVRSGDTLEKIANDHRVSVTDLKAWNGLRKSKIVVGQTLEIYGEPEERGKIIASNSAQKKQASGHHTKDKKTSTLASNVLYHRVKKGETLWQIAKMYGVSVKELESYNNKGDDLKPGDRLIIPQR